MKTFIVTVIGLILAGPLLGMARADIGPAISLTVDGGSNLPLNGTTTKLTVSFAGGPTPTLVQLSRDGGVPFSMWPGSATWVLSPNGGSISRDWCISFGCWGGVAGPHILTVSATYATGIVFIVSIPLNVADGQAPTPPVTAGAGPAHPADAVWNGYNWVPVFRVYP